MPKMQRYCDFFKRKRMLSFSMEMAISNGIPKQGPKTKLITNGLNIIKAMQKFRNIHISEIINDLNLVQLLTLSYIFPVDRHSKSRYPSNYLDKDLVVSSKDPVSIKRVSSESVLYVKELLDLYNNEKGLDSADFKPYHHKQVDLATCVFKHGKSETTFMNQKLMPFLQTILLEGTNGSTIYSIIDGPEEKKKKKPDFMLDITDRKREAYYFYVEVKRPDPKSIYQEEDDYVKLLKQMKGSIDNQAREPCVSRSSL